MPSVVSSSCRQSLSLINEDLGESRCSDFPPAFDIYVCKAFHDVMKVVVSQELCAGHGECVAIAPEVFAFVGDDEVVSVVLSEPTGDLCAAVADAVTCCPTQAISIVE